jgi:hypothetical protein
MKRTDSGLWIAPNFNMLRYRKRERTVTLPNGERAKVTIDDSGTVRQIEHGEHLDGIVRPEPIRMALRPFSVSMSTSAKARPNPLRTGFRILKGSR